MGMKLGQYLIDIVRGKKKIFKSKFNFGIKRIINLRGFQKIKARKLVSKKIKNNEKIMLHLGCGTIYKEGWINIDNNSDDNICKLDLNWDLRFPLPFADNSVDFIYNEHFLEHLTAEEGQRAIKDFMRVLKLEGVMRMAMPDLKDTIKMYLDNNWKETNKEFLEKFGLTGIQTKAEMLNVNFRWWGHKWLYDWEELERRLKDVGATQIKKCEIFKSDYCELNDLETRNESTLVVEFKKNTNRMAFVFRNFYNYEQILPVPKYLPKSLETVYITDSSKNAKKATKLGWDKTVIIKNHLRIKDKAKRRVALADFNCFPEKFIDGDYDYIFFTDPNVIEMDSNYQDFVDKAINSNCTLFVTSGWYSGEENNIKKELERSLHQERWNYAFSAMEKSTLRYINEMEKNNINYLDIPVVSAKFIGWNMKKKLGDDYLSKKLLNEFNQHLQGNIILSYLLAMHSNEVFHYTEFKNDGAVVAHNFQA